MRFGILGETRAWHDDGTEAPLGGPARRALLALLLLRPGAVVPAERLAGELGQGAEPSAHALQSQVSRLRAALGPEAAIERTGAGYRIVVPADAVDAVRFERLAAEGRAALRDGDAGAAVRLLREGLGLWRGPALAGLPDGESAHAAAARLEELRLAALEDRIEGELRLGEHRAAVPELRELSRRHPLRERTAALLMRALSAGGGQAEALLVFEETRRRLAGELGADPSPELAALHRELLAAGPAPSPAAPPAQLTSFVGREREVAGVAALLRTARLVTLTGPGGVGKTRLAVEVAAGADGEVCFAELAALSDGGGLPQALLAALGLRHDGLQLAGGARAPLERLVAALSDRELLLVLDNCEHLIDEAAALAGRLLAACPRLRVLATSREPLAVIGEHVWPVRPLDGAAAVRLFADRAAAAGRGLAADPGLVRRICAALDDLPLAIELAAARLRTLGVRELAARLDDVLGVTARGVRTADGRHRTLRSVVAWSWELLSPEEQRAARRFTVFAGGASGRAAREVCGAGGDVLESLADKSLLEVAGDGRVRMLETIRAYGAERLEEAGEGEEARRAHARQLLELARAADAHLLRAEQLDWLPVLGAEHGNLLAALRWAAGAGERALGLRLLAAASAYLWIRGVSASVAPYAIALLSGEPPQDGGPGEEYAICVLHAAAVPAGRELWLRHAAAAGEALAAAWPGDRAGRHPAALLLWMMRNAGERDPGDAFTLVSAQRDCPDPWARALSHYVGGFDALGTGGAAAGEDAFRAAAEGFRETGDRWGLALALDVLAGLASGRGDHAEAIALTDRALTLSGQLGALEDHADFLVNRADYLISGDAAGDGAEDFSAARAGYASAAALARRAGSSSGLAAALRGFGDLALLAGDLAEAERLYARALERNDPHWVKSLGTQVRILVGLGRVAAAHGDQSTAATRYRQAAEAAAVMGPAVPGALRLLGLPAGIAAVLTSG
ncbi:BTAD domain-containing putative transcriptional regulator [Nonomuraea bangladeshensis]|uniref:BTAD domain-containing putative transcriptional regulator n=1 Tax=Nonomuraea bangladeshensis TaxID=404385 RepID=UPI003C2B4F67